MKDKIAIVSWILTRKCNLKCSYCAIVKNYEGKPPEYPDMKHYYQKEMSTKYVIETLKKIKLHNPDAFMLFYGGEPILRHDLADIINFCNDEDIHYTIITNNSDEIQDSITNLLVECETIQGLTSSVDPMIFDKNSDKTGDRYKKCIAGLERLKKYKGIINDIVAEITVDNQSINYLYDLVKMLTDMGISSDITTVDIKKNKFYDFSNVTDEKVLVPKSVEVMAIFQRIIDEKLDAHMADTLLPKIWDILPAELDCGLEKNVHNMTIDADGSARLCLRIRGIQTPNMKAYDCFLDNGELHPHYKRSISDDKHHLCQGCNWTCQIMSQMLSKGEDEVDNLIHSDRRN